MTSTRGSASLLSSMRQELSGAAVTNTSGIARRLGRAAEGAAGLGVEAADLGDHVGEVFVVDAAERGAAPAKSRLASTGRLAISACIAGS